MYLFSTAQTMLTNFVLKVTILCLFVNIEARYPNRLKLYFFLNTRFNDRNGNGPNLPIGGRDPNERFNTNHGNRFRS